MATFKSVDDYIAAQPESMRPTLEQVRAAIRKALPKADECIAYNMPAYRKDGRAVIFFAGWKKHYSLYPADAVVQERYAKELSRYTVEKGTIRFPWDDTVPVRLITGIAKLRLEPAPDARYSEGEVPTMSHWHDDPELWKELLPVLTSPQMIEAAHNEARQVVELLALPEQARILDLGCGPGRHSLALARLGHRVTGVDATGPYLELARSRAMEEGLTIDFVHDSMLNFRREAAFDGITCLFTSFGYFESREDDQRVLNNMFANLRPCGRAVIDVFGKETMARIYTPRRWQEVGNGRYWLTDSDVESAWEKVRNKWVFVGGGETREFQFSHRIYSGGELDIMMRAAGFADVRILGGLDGAPYDRNAVRLVAIGTK